MKGMSSRATWWWLVGIAGSAAVAGEILLSPVRGGTGRSLWLGIGAASLLLACGLLGPRKRMLRLRMGPIRWWNASHNALGALALLLGLLHCGFQWGGVLTSALLGGLVLLTISGLVGSVLQVNIPKLMTSRLHRESPHRYFPALLVGHWRRVHDLVVAECGPQPEAAHELARAERAAGLPEVGSAPASKERAEADAIDLETIASFYATRIVPFVVGSKASGSLASESEARLALDALRANVEPSRYELVTQIESIIQEIRMCMEERRLHHWIFDWQLMHIPLAVLVVVLMLVHAMAALYY
ncbi:MAG: hypothetical protein AAF799_41680 [Myxococcota bacterium]